MHQSLVKFSESEASNHAPSLADFTTTMPELKFSVYTGAGYDGSICLLPSSLTVFLWDSIRQSAFERRLVGDTDAAQGWHK
jgi:hypothetical protein